MTTKGARPIGSREGVKKGLVERGDERTEAVRDTAISESCNRSDMVERVERHTRLRNSFMIIDTYLYIGPRLCRPTVCIRSEMALGIRLKIIMA